VRGGMYWKRQGETEYLIRTSPRNTQKSLGPRSDKTVQIYEKFVARKEELERRLSDLTQELERQQRMNRALRVGRAPRLLVDILNKLAKSGLSEYFTVVGTHALYAYETASGVQFGNADALATRDVDLLLDTRKRLSFITQMGNLGSSMLELIKKVDSTFEIRPDQKYTAVNSKGFEIDIIRREAKEGDPHPLRLTDDENDFFAVQAKRAGDLLAGPRFSSMIVSATGHMARMNTISPLAFVKFKRWMAEQPDRDPLRRRRDKLQADLVEELVKEYLPHIT
jgi:Nucleotidyltransferase